MLFVFGGVHGFVVRFASASNLHWGICLTGSLAGAGRPLASREARRRERRGSDGSERLAGQLKLLEGRRKQPSGTFHFHSEPRDPKPGLETDPVVGKERGLERRDKESTPRSPGVNPQDRLVWIELDGFLSGLGFMPPYYCGWTTSCTT